MDRMLAGKVPADATIAICDALQAIGNGTPGVEYLSILLDVGGDQRRCEEFLSRPANHLILRPQVYPFDKRGIHRHVASFRVFDAIDDITERLKQPISEGDRAFDSHIHELTLANRTAQVL